MVGLFFCLKFGSLGNSCTFVPVKQQQTHTDMTIVETIYTVHIEGEYIKNTDTEFTSLKAAKEFMKSKYDFCKKWEAYKLVLVKRDYYDDGDYMVTGINTRTTIMA